MAGRKLSTERKEALRSEMRERLANGERTAFIVAEQAVKYSITPNTVRWHMKRLSPGPVLHPNSRRAKPEGPTPVLGGIKKELAQLVKRASNLHRKYMEAAEGI